MEVLIAVLHLLGGLFGATKAYLELKDSRETRDDRTKARDDVRRPKHLRE